MDNTKQLKQRVWVLEMQVSLLLRHRQEEAFLLEQQHSMRGSQGGACAECGAWGTLDNPPQCHKPGQCPHGLD